MNARLLDEAAVRLEICRFGRSFFDRGYVRATAGNISVRLADGFLITQTDACLGSLDPDRLARLDADPRLRPCQQDDHAAPAHLPWHDREAAHGCSDSCCPLPFERQLVSPDLRQRHTTLRIAAYSSRMHCWSERGSKWHRMTHTTMAPQ